METHRAEFEWLNQEWISHLFQSYESLTSRPIDPTVPDAGAVYIFHNAVINHALGTHMNTKQQETFNSYVCGENGGKTKTNQPCRKTVSICGTRCNLHTPVSFIVEFPPGTRFQTVEVYWISDGYMSPRQQIWIQDDLYGIFADGHEFLFVDYDILLSFPHTSILKILDTSNIK